MTELLDDLLEDLIRAEKKSDEGRAVSSLLDQLAASTKSHRPRVVMEFVVKDGSKAGKVLKKLRTHGVEKVEKKASQIVKEWKRIVQTESTKKEKEKEMRRPKVVRITINEVEHVIKAETAGDKVKCPISGCTWKGFADKVADHVEKSRSNGCKKHGAIGLESKNLSGVEAANMMHPTAFFTTKGEAGQKIGED
mmetsp:Transcript_43531/g.102276  ORF Transcript_43531/g.102276 Transcript_43531/m.102276 type:complete len:194 (+) Transcript_43531:102-683(+)|eukprot:CAMPEP_0177702042 /NCGR_PEP_ID=MMETSP0484_2-20121128/6931_1 /TAXON_ID=354590 /ORGANISM="Rhodomonas lens, Strain RHODO" /LENGTH=193 /DNA_ID=CAMNT_0019213311 /DNA_START=99 /DNA_END=680 /DNA_ORIENTATION=+